MWGAWIKLSSLLKYSKLFAKNISAAPLSRCLWIILGAIRAGLRGLGFVEVQGAGHIVSTAPFVKGEPMP